jgi:hypothetical protein
MDCEDYNCCLLEGMDSATHISRYFGKEQPLLLKSDGPRRQLQLDGVATGILLSYRASFSESCNLYQSIIDLLSEMLLS